MKAVHMSVLLAMVLATALTNAQPMGDCQRMVTENVIKLSNHLPRVTSSCGTLECSADCKSALNSLKADLGSCFTSTPGTEALQVLLDQCGIPTGCSGNCRRSSASGVFISLCTVGLASTFHFIIN